MNVYSEINRIRDGKARSIAQIEEKGVMVPSDARIDDLPDYIAQIGKSQPLDPVYVYNTTRPADWLEMPTPNDDEIYLLFHIPDGLSSLVAFIVTCDGDWTGSYTVALGTVDNGEFVEYSSTSVESRGKYEAELFADDYGNLTSTGMKQVMIKISATDILTWQPKPHSKKTAPNNFAGWNIVEVACRCPKATRILVGSSSANLSLKKLIYFAMYGINAITDMAYMFRYCYALKAVVALDTTNAIDMSSTFNYCYSLMAYPELNTQNAVNMSNMFNYCTALSYIRDMDTSNVTNMSLMFSRCHSVARVPSMNTHNVINMQGMFNMCYALTFPPQIDTHAVTNMDGMFNSCIGTISIPKLNTSSCMNMENAFYNCSALETITVDNSVTGWDGCDISLLNCSMSHNAIIDFFNSLPTITSAKAITLTGNYGASDLTDVDKAIATQKGWTLTI